MIVTLLILSMIGIIWSISGLWECGEFDFLLKDKLLDGKITPPAPQKEQRTWQEVLFESFPFIAAPGKIIVSDVHGNEGIIYGWHSLSMAANAYRHSFDFGQRVVLRDANAFPLEINGNKYLVVDQCDIIGLLPLKKPETTLPKPETTLP